MASLLAWVCDPGHEPDPALWTLLQQAAAARVRTSGQTHVGPGVRAWAAPSRMGAGPALSSAAGRVRLGDVPGHYPEDWTRAPETPAALVDIDTETRRIVLLRDLLGQRPLVYARIAHGWLLASGEAVLLRHPAVSAALDHDWLLAYFACIGLPADGSVYRAIRTVAPGARAELCAEMVRIRASPLQPMTDTLADGDWLAALRAALETACQRAVNGMDRVGISLSGGLDSSAVAAMATRERQASVHAVCYGSGRYATLDERPWAQELATLLGASIHTLDTDPHAPLAGSRPVSLDTPVASPYRELKSAVYARLQQVGVDVLLTGNFADHLCASPAQALAEALRRRRYQQQLRHYVQRMRQRGLRALWYDRGWRALLRGQPLPVLPSWLRPETRAQAEIRRAEALKSCAAWPRPTQAAHVLGGYAAFDAAGEVEYADFWGIEVRHPFRDVQLTRLALSAPADLSWRNGIGKWWERECLKGVLPDAWRLRDKSASMQPLYQYGIQQARERCRALIALGRPVWSAYVDGEPEINVDSLLRSEHGSLLIWLLCGFGLWLESHPDRDEILASTPGAP